ncbi:acetyl-CoA carboxylase biotin carboxylase subunit [Candidatus Amarolinea aalborgensis]|jgi:acetyl/propionyl-CoA carboxylase alpha subunit|uniref:acetyl-CoA carboxylase biotin carboxylase subunit n=1 Tax=Candidatus Amarolinea aalborgensis TaxID=2249329 RepID=UPI003BF9F4A1
MFRKVLIANRGEIAVRIIRACRDLGIQTVGLFEPSDQGSLHVRFADEVVRLDSSLGYMDHQVVLQAAKETGADAIHPGYGFLAEDPDFVKACEAANVVFIGPPSSVVSALRDNLGARERVAAAGFPVPHYIPEAFCQGEMDGVQALAEQIGYPLVIKACRGGRGRGTRLVTEPSKLERAVRQAQAEARTVFGDEHVYLEKAIMPARHVEVQILGDQYGHLIHLGERDGSIMRHSQKLVVESPSPNLTPEQRAHVWQMGLDIARLFNYCNAGTVEFIMDMEGNFYFAEMKARIQVEHPVTEKVTQVDLVREQIRIAAGEPLAFRQEEIQFRGWALECRINAEDPWNNFLPSPGKLDRFRLPGGPNVRVDTYAYNGCSVPVRYDPILAKLIVWGETRVECINRMRRALEEFAIRGVRTTLPYHQRILTDPDFLAGNYTVDFLDRPLLEGEPEIELRDMAVAAAVAFISRNQRPRPVTPGRFQDGWHRNSRRLPS